MARNLDDRRVAHRDPAHMLDRHRLLVVRQRIRRNTIDHPQRPIQANHHRRQRLVAQRHHHPKPRPRQPRTEQHRPRPGDLRPVTVIPLQPQPRLRNPRPRPAPVLVAPTPLGLRNRPPRRAIRPLIAHRDQHPMHHISPHQRAGTIDQLIDLRRERVNQRPLPCPFGQPTTRRVARRDQPRDRLVITPRQRRRSPQRPRRVIRLQESPSLPPACFTAALLRSRVTDNARRSTGSSGQNRGEKPWPPMGRNGGHQRGDSTAAYGEVLMATVRFPLSGPQVRTSTSDLKRHAQHTARLDLRATSATRPPRSQPSRFLSTNPVQHRISGSASISPAYPTRKHPDHPHL